MNDKKFRPAVANHVENMKKYDTVYIGFPIWWYVAPTIINTFLEQYDLTGKTPLCHFWQQWRGKHQQGVCKSLQKYDTA